MSFEVTNPKFEIEEIMGCNVTFQALKHDWEQKKKDYITT